MRQRAPAETLDGVLPDFGCCSGLHRVLLFLTAGKRQRHVHTKQGQDPTATQILGKKTILLLEAAGKKQKTFPRTVTNYIKSESLLKVFTLGSKIATLVTFSTGSISHCTVSNEAD